MKEMSTRTFDRAINLTGDLAMSLNGESELVGLLALLMYTRHALKKNLRDAPVVPPECSELEKLIGAMVSQIKAACAKLEELDPNFPPVKPTEATQ